MTLPRFYAIVDWDLTGASGRNGPALARACLDAGVGLLQVRAKAACAAELLQACAEIGAHARRTRASLVVNDRSDVARLVEGAGVHVGQEDLPPALARQIVGADRIVGFSTHTPSQVDAALAEPIDYLAVGPVFGTRTKETGYGRVGLELVRYAAHAAASHAERSGARPLPVVAIGGITVENASTVMAAGASAVAVISDVFTGGDPVERVRAFLRELG